MTSFNTLEDTSVDAHNTLRAMRQRAVRMKIYLSEELWCYRTRATARQGFALIVNAGS
ncbi:MAG: hypothetical protein KME46_04070 [Brasilonema angustatum HA4187-MV1]|nr:hypothetical protein [Brasilonema angustatum HA4187-MV1]